VSFRLEREGRRRLVLVDEMGRRYEDVEPVRAFPLSAPDQLISICDSNGREILHIESLEEVEERDRRILEAELAEREFAPVILHILNSPPESEPSTWRVKTDRGVVTFEVESDESVRRREVYRLSIVDSNGIRYEVADTRKLDPHSRRILDRFL